MKRFASGAGLWLLAAAVSCASAAYPDRPLTLVNPYPASGTPDITGTPRITKLVKMIQTLSVPSLPDSLAQQLAYALSGPLGQPVRIDRRAASKTLAAARYTAQAPGDGYTLLFVGNPTLTILPAQYPRLPFDPGRELLPVAAYAHMPMALVAAADRQAETVRDIVLRSRRAAAGIDYASAGDGTTAWLTGELFRRQAQADLVHVSYNGSVPAVNAVITGQVEFGIVPLPGVLPYLGGGKLRVLAVSSAHRHAAVPAAPTLAESGLAGFDSGGWFGVFAPVRTSGTIVSLLNHEINRVAADAAVQQDLVERGFSPARGSAEEFRALIARDRTRWRELVNDAAGAP